MDKQPENPRVYPRPHYGEDGIKLRDEIAIKAMERLIERGSMICDITATEAYKYADAMLKARENKTNN